VRGRQVVLALAGCASVALGCGGTATRTVTKTVASTTTKASPARPASNVVLGAKNFVRGGEGWGTAQPSMIYNGGDQSGLARDIHWTNWGQPVATGTGLTSIFKPEGGYYPQRATIALRASDIGTCTPGGPRAYRRLSTRVPTRPGGPLGPWGQWAKTMCSYDAGQSTSPEPTTTTTSSQPPESEPQVFRGNGVESLGKITVATPSTLHWSCSGCTIFSVTGSAEGAAIVIDSQKHSAGVTAVEPGAYHSVDVQAYGEAGVAGEWTITITPGQ
jgi:hypothetical protein